MRNKGELLVGVLLGAAGIVAVGFALKKFLANKKVQVFEEKLVDFIADNSPIKRALPKAGKRKKKSVGGKKKQSKLAVAKLGNAKKLLSIMKKGESYTQVALQNTSKFPYRSVRRYVEALLSQGKISASGYGKGKKFKKV